jgi:hypothetical protein
MRGGDHVARLVRDVLIQGTSAKGLVLTPSDTTGVQSTRSGGTGVQPTPHAQGAVETVLAEPKTETRKKLGMQPSKKL